MVADITTPSCRGSRHVRKSCWSFEECCSNRLSVAPVTRFLTENARITNQMSLMTFLQNIVCIFSETVEFDKLLVMLSYAGLFKNIES